ncbi:MAG TPA: PA2779 family protein, partial [Burkholderiales bacterium]|nr:PA2779 family protein [Burkholderiales bacterium]
MNKLRRLARPIGYVVTLGVLALSVHLPAAHAAVIGTEAVISAQQAELDRARVQDLLGRVEIKQQLLAAGVDPGQVSERVDALNDSEV